MAIASTQLSHYQYRTWREVDEAVGAAAEHALVELRMAGSSDDEEIDLEFTGKPHNVAHRMSG